MMNRRHYSLVLNKYSEDRLANGCNTPLGFQAALNVSSLRSNYALSQMANVGSSKTFYNVNLRTSLKVKVIQYQETFQPFSRQTTWHASK